MNLICLVLMGIIIDFFSFLILIRVGFIDEMSCGFIIFVRS